MKGRLGIVTRRAAYKITRNTPLSITHADRLPPPCRPLFALLASLAKVRVKDHIQQPNILE